MKVNLRRLQSIVTNVRRLDGRSLGGICPAISIHLSVAVAEMSAVNYPDFAATITVFCLLIYAG